MKLMIIALAALLHQLFPAFELLYNTLVTTFGRGSAMRPMANFILIVAYVPHLAVAWYMLRSINIGPYALQLVHGRRLIKLGLCVYAVYLLIAFYVQFFVKTPYDGVGLGRILGTLIFVTRALLFAGLFVALVKELPLARLESAGDPKA